MPEIEQPIEVMLWNRVRPVPATSLVLLLLSLVFIAQLIFARLPVETPTVPELPDLVRFGALNGDLIVYGGDWWRLFTAPFLHAHLLHLLVNGIVLWISGSYVERVLGGSVMLATLAVGGLAGSLLSFDWYDLDHYGIGASGAIMALVAVAAASSYLLFPDEEEITHRGRRMLNVLVLSLIPRSSGVDYAAHLGGALAGGAIALWLYTVLEAPVAQATKVERLCKYVSGLFAAGALYGAVSLMLLPPMVRADWPFLSIPEFKVAETQTLEELRALTARYKADSALTALIARAQYKAGDFAGAEQSGRWGLRLFRTQPNWLFTIGADDDLKALIALGHAGATGDHAVRHDACNTVDKELIALLKAASLCNGQL